MAKYINRQLDKGEDYINDQANKANSELENVYNTLEQVNNTLTKANTLQNKLKQKNGVKSPNFQLLNYQTGLINSEIPKLEENMDLYESKTKYQMEMYSSVKFVNDVFLIFYIILFSVIHLLFLVQYLQGVKRDEIADTIWLTVFFFYPYLIYYIERTIYFCINYFLSLIYGKTYVYDFDKMLLFTDFYKDPGANKPEGVLTG